MLYLFMLISLHRWRYYYYIFVGNASEFSPFFFRPISLELTSSCETFSKLVTETLNQYSGGVRRINSAAVSGILVCPKSDLHFPTYLAREKTEDPRTVPLRLFTHVCNICL